MVIQYLVLILMLLAFSGIAGVMLGRLFKRDKIGQEKEMSSTQFSLLIAVLFGLIYSYNRFERWQMIELSIFWFALISISSFFIAIYIGYQSIDDKDKK